MKKLIKLELLIMIPALLIFFTVLGILVFVEMKLWLEILLGILSFALILFATFYVLRLEQKTGYYECRYCKHHYIPTYKQVSLAPHMGWARNMRCPKCDKIGWQRKFFEENKK